MSILKNNSTLRTISSFEEREQRRLRFQWPGKGVSEEATSNIQVGSDHLKPTGFGKDFGFALNGVRSLTSDSSFQMISVYGTEKRNSGEKSRSRKLFHKLRKRSGVCLG